MLNSGGCIRTTCSRASNKSRTLQMALVHDRLAPMRAVCRRRSAWGVRGCWSGCSSRPAGWAMGASIGGPGRFFRTLAVDEPAHRHGVPLAGSGRRCRRGLWCRPPAFVGSSAGRSRQRRRPLARSPRRRRGVAGADRDRVAEHRDPREHGCAVEALRASTASGRPIWSRTASRLALGTSLPPCRVAAWLGIHFNFDFHHCDPVSGCPPRRFAGPKAGGTVGRRDRAMADKGRGGSVSAPVSPSA